MKKVTFAQYISGTKPTPPKPRTSRPSPRPAPTQGEIFAALDHAFGFSDARPGVMMFGVNPDRVRGFTERWMAQHNLQLVKR